MFILFVTRCKPLSRLTQYDVSPTEPLSLTRDLWALWKCHQQDPAQTGRMSDRWHLRPWTASFVGWVLEKWEGIAVDPGVIPLKDSLYANSCQQRQCRWTILYYFRHILNGRKARLHLFYCVKWIADLIVEYYILNIEPGENVSCMKSKKSLFFQCWNNTAVSISVSF